MKYKFHVLAVAICGLLLAGCNPEPVEIEVPSSTMEPTNPLMGWKWTSVKTYNGFGYSNTEYYTFVFDTDTTIFFDYTYVYQSGPVTDKSDEQEQWTYTYTDTTKYTFVRDADGHTRAFGYDSIHHTLSLYNNAFPWKDDVEEPADVILKREPLK